MKEYTSQAGLSSIIGIKRDLCDHKCNGKSTTLSFSGDSSEKERTYFLGCLLVHLFFARPTNPRLSTPLHSTLSIQPVQPVCELWGVPGTHSSTSTALSSTPSPSDRQPNLVFPCAHLSINQQKCPRCSHVLHSLKRVSNSARAQKDQRHGADRRALIQQCPPQTEQHRESDCRRRFPSRHRLCDAAGHRPQSPLRGNENKKKKTCL